jgi:hypothetical protein
MDDLCKSLITRVELKEKIFDLTGDIMKLFKEAAADFELHFKKHYANDHAKVEVMFQNKNQYEFLLKFGSDVLIFIMHTDIFEFSREHEIMRTKYIMEDKERSFCGMIQIFNFLSDSFKYNRVNDLGYMIGRIMVNKDNHFYVEGKRELAQLLNNFSEFELTSDKVSEILHSAIKYAVNFDLLLPKYETTKEISVQDIIQFEDSVITLTTAKRLGFRFEADKNKV